jgi:hypothetical protein
MINRQFGSSYVVPEAGTTLKFAAVRDSTSRVSRYTTSCRKAERVNI